MAQKKQKRQATAATPKANAVERDEAEKSKPTASVEPSKGPQKIGGHAQDSSADKARRASDAVLGDIIGMAKPIAIPDLPEDEVELSVGEDRKRLLLQGLALLVAVLALLFLSGAALLPTIRATSGCFSCSLRRSRQRGSCLSAWADSSASFS